MNKKEKGLMDLDNSVVIAGGEGGIRGLNSNGKNTMKITFLKKTTLGGLSTGRETQQCCEWQSRQEEAALT